MKASEARHVAYDKWVQNISESAKMRDVMDQIYCESHKGCQYVDVYKIEDSEVRHYLEYMGYALTDFKSEHGWNEEYTQIFWGHESK